jgi:hypothetical protein
MPLSLYTLTRLGPKQTNDQVQPLDLAPCVLVVEISFRSVGLQAPMLVGVEQAIEVEARHLSLFASRIASTLPRPLTYCRRAKYTPIRITAPPTIFSIPSVSPKKTIPEATPTTVIKYW